jgi:hypothetical protein
MKDLIEELRIAAKDLTEIVRMPNAEYVADAHNAAVRKIREIVRQQGKQGTCADLPLTIKLPGDGKWGD